MSTGLQLHPPDADDWISIFVALREAGATHPQAHDVARSVTRRPSPLRSVSRREVEEALSMLIDEACPGLRGPDLLSDAADALMRLRSKKPSRPRLVKALQAS